MAGAVNPNEDLRNRALAAMVVADPASVKLLQQIQKIALVESTVLIQGESGVGKDLVASLLHYLGPKPEQPLLKIDCASLPTELLESELFGYERGAFTGASQMKRGRLELAGQGAVILDEVSSLTMPMQAKMLRVIQERTFDRLGGTRPVSLKARVIAISNVDLEDAVARRSFREDLYYRLNVVPLHISPLRDRSGDVLPIANILLQRFSATYHRPQLRLSVDAKEALQSYSFPGNVRELRNLLERAVIHSAGDELEVSDLPANIRNGAAKVKRPSLEEMERTYIAEILDYTRGKKSKAAEILGISRKNLLEKRKKYDL
ncbi:MAG TPA: sigma-54 dependent transcriptional regulator [Terriglobales bacterium]|nr:sigma-54 dependent transcriptional regulator [Terriglobales bacterium]